MDIGGVADDAASVGKAITAIAASVRAVREAIVRKQGIELGAGPIEDEIGLDEAVLRIVDQLEAVIDLLGSTMQRSIRTEDEVIELRRVVQQLRNKGADG